MNPIDNSLSDYLPCEDSLSVYELRELYIKDKWHVFDAEKIRDRSNNKKDMKARKFIRSNEDIIMSYLRSFVMAGIAIICFWVYVWIFSLFISIAT